MISLIGGLKAWSHSFEYASGGYNINNDAKVKLLQFRRIGKGCMSYLLNSNCQSVVIDPVYPIDDYIKKASEIGAKITKVIDTHQHADRYFSWKERAKRTGAIHYQSSYENYVSEGKGDKQVIEGDIIDVGKIKIKAIHTPGHTNGSISFSVDDGSLDSNKNDRLLFTGDTLFVNGIGRPDLREQAKEFASVLYDILHDKLFVMHKDVVVFPAHFDKDAQSQQVISSSLGEIEKKASELLGLDRQSFVDRISSLVMPAPYNFKEIIAINAGVKPVPTLAGVYELEIGPNRCGIPM